MKSRKAISSLAAYVNTTTTIFEGCVDSWIMDNRSTLLVFSNMKFCARGWESSMLASQRLDYEREEWHWEQNLG